jgi:hypothetical protein
MRSTCSVLAVVLAVSLAASPAVAAPQMQSAQHVAGQQQLDAAVQEHVRSAESDRETVRRFLQRDEVRELAGRYGLDIRRADSAVSVLDGTQLASIAAQARQAEEALAGGQSTVTISITTIIIILLVLILLIVALR